MEGLKVVCIRTRREWLLRPGLLVSSESANECVREPSLTCDSRKRKCEATTERFNILAFSFRRYTDIISDPSPTCDTRKSDSGGYDAVNDSDLLEQRHRSLAFCGRQCAMDSGALPGSRFS